MSTRTQWRTLTEVQNPMEADLISSLLASAGIDSFIPDRNLGLIYGGALGIRVQVPVEDWSQAKAILAASPLNPGPDQPTPK